MTVIGSYKSGGIDTHIQDFLLWNAEFMHKAVDDFAQHIETFRGILLFIRNFLLRSYNNTIEINQGYVNSKVAYIHTHKITGIGFYTVHIRATAAGSFLFSKIGYKTVFH